MTTMRPMISTNRRSQALSQSSWKEKAAPKPGIHSGPCSRITSWLRVAQAAMVEHTSEQAVSTRTKRPGHARGVFSGGVRKPPKKKTTADRRREQDGREECIAGNQVLRIYHFRRSSSSALIVPRFRKRAMRIPSATAVSATATLMTRSANA